jgi:excisionase family DNA binding protein
MTAKPRTEDSPATASPWMTAEDVAKYLQVSLSTVHRWRREGRLVSYKIGNLRRFRQEEVDALLIASGPGEPA